MLEKKHSNGVDDEKAGGLVVKNGEILKTVWTRILIAVMGHHG